jgi:predicted nucleotidyltransferase
VSGVEQLLKALSDNQVKFIVVGAYAAIMQGSTLRTDDLDICYERTPANYKRIICAIAPFRPRLRGLPNHLKAPFDEKSLAQGTNFTLITDLGSLDLLGEMSGVGGYRQIVDDAKVINLGNVSCQVASLETIIKSKEAANRPKDRATLPELKALRMIQEKTPKNQTDKR